MSYKKSMFAFLLMALAQCLGAFSGFLHFLGAADSAIRVESPNITFPYSGFLACHRGVTDTGQYLIV